MFQVADDEIQVVCSVAIRLCNSQRIEGGIYLFLVADDEVQVVRSIASRLYN